MNAKLILLLLFILAATGTKAQSWQWARRDYVAGMEGYTTTTDPSGNVICAGFNLGWFGSVPPVPAVFGSDTVQYSVDADQVGPQGIIVKYDGSGHVLWVRGTKHGDTIPYWVTTDKDGNIYLLGSFFSDSLEIGGVTVYNTKHNYPYFLVKFDGDGNVLWARAEGGTIGNVLPAAGSALLISSGAVATDSAGNVYVVSDFPDSAVTVGSYSFANADGFGSSADMVIVKYDKDGNVLWANAAGGERGDYGFNLTVTPAGDVYVVGVTHSSSFHIGGFTLSDASGGGGNTVIARLHADGTVMWACTSGGVTGGDYASGIASDKANNVYITGTFPEASISFAGTTLTNPANASAYVLRLNPDNTVAWNKILYDPTSSFSFVLGYSVAMNPCGALWTSGAFSSECKIDGHKLTSTSEATDPVYLVAFSTSGAYLNGTTLASGADDQNAIACDATGNVYLCSDFEGDEVFTVGPDVLVETGFAVPECMYVAKYGALSTAPLDTFFTHSDTSLCTIPEMALNVPAGYTSYLWSNGSTGASISINREGSYWVTAAGDCSVPVLVDTFNVKKISVDLNFSLGNDTTTCGPYVLSVPLAGASYTWQDGSTDSTLIVTQTGQYYVTVEEQGCTNADTVNVTENELQTSVRDTMFCAEDFTGYMAVENVPAGASVLWSNGGTGSSATLNEAGTYWAMVQQGSCTVTDTVHVTTQLCNCQVYMPTAFSPNDDGKNDTYMPLVQPGCNISSYSFTIYNRWGQEVFHSDHPGEKWDGYFQGANAEIGTYMYYLKYTSGGSGKKTELKGDITLLR